MGLVETKGFEEGFEEGFEKGFEKGFYSTTNPDTDCGHDRTPGLVYRCWSPGVVYRKLRRLP